MAIALLFLFNNPKILIQGDFGPSASLTLIGRDSYPGLSVTAQMLI